MSGYDHGSADARGAAGSFGAFLREWRIARRLSQLQLALEAGISARHLSYVETGKAGPSREMVEQLADALAVPLRERNTLLVAAGFAPIYRETALSAPEMALVRRAIEFILRQQEPYPALVVSRHWDVLMGNRALERVFTALRGGVTGHANIVRQVFDPNDLRPCIANWAEVAGDLIRHLHHDLAAAPSDTKLRALLDEALSFEGVPQNWRSRELAASPLPVMTSAFRKGEIELCFFSTLTVFGTTRDVTVQEMRIECMFPADEATTKFCEAVAQ
jgi:transcriptional regulator with XRE-family HTH domain